MRKYKHLILILLLIALYGLARADYHYAGHEGTNQYPYTSWETAADSIQKAVDASSPHDTVYIGAGEWHETVATGVYDSVAIIGMGMDSTFCFSDEYQEPVLTVDYNCSVEGTTFQHLDNWWCLRGRAYAGVSIKNCRFRDTQLGLDISGGITEISNCIFDNCELAIIVVISVDTILISNNYLHDIYSLSSAIKIQNCDYATIENNIIINNRPDYRNTAGIICGGQSTTRNNIIINGRVGIACSPPLKYNNTIINQSAYGIITTIGGNTINNNSISDCDEAIHNWVESRPAVKYNNFWDNNNVFFTPPGDTIGNIYRNPMFVSGEDVHLQAYSPLIDAGHPDWLDVDGSRSDIGAYGGPYGEIYEYPDLSPAVPDSLTGRFIADTVSITWRYNTEADFSHYQLHKDTISNFEPSIFNQIAESETSFYIDTDVDREHSYYYRLASIDNQDNLSDYSAELEVVPTGIWDQPGTTLPKITAIQTNYPNPFNSSTTIIYSVANLGPIPAEIEINIYDITGRKIRTVVNERRDLGEHTIIWNGKDDNGADCSAGIYFAKISQWGLEVSGKPRKLVLIK